MEETINRLSKTLTSLCNHLESSCDALKLSVDRRPIPLDSASSAFIQCLNRRVSTASSDLNLLETMSFGTVSFEELLGHCNEVYKRNQSDLLQLQHHLPDVDVDDEEEEDEKYSEPTAASSVFTSFKDDPLMDDSLSLKSLGLSDVCLATLASEANSKIGDSDRFMRMPMGECGEKQYSVRNTEHDSAKTREVNKVTMKLSEDVKPFIKVSKDDYDGLPSYMKSLASWEDLLAAVGKINSSLGKKDTEGNYYFHQDEITSLGLGPKARTYLLVLMRMNQLAVETIDGSISYKLFF